MPPDSYGHRRYLVELDDLRVEATPIEVAAIFVNAAQILGHRRYLV